MKELGFKPGVKGDDCRVGKQTAFMPMHSIRTQKFYLHLNEEAALPSCGPLNEAHPVSSL